MILLFRFFSTFYPSEKSENKRKSSVPFWQKNEKNEKIFLCYHMLFIYYII
jgi:hypothetical protein